MRTKTPPRSYSVILTAHYEDGSEAVLRMEDYGLLRELIDDLEDMINQQGWLLDADEDTA